MKKRVICALLAVAVSMLSLSMVSCDGVDDKIEAKNKIFYDYFDTVSVIYDYTGGTEEDFSAYCDRIEVRLNYYHSLFNIYAPEGDGITGLADLNAAAGNGAVRVSEEMISFLEYCKEIYELTDGYVNVAMGAVLSIWHEHREAGIADPSTASIPTMDELEAAWEHCDIDAIIIDRENMTVELTDPEMSLDGGAIAKGYATELIAQYLASEGLSGYVLDIGGNLRTVGTKPNGDGWTTGVKNPDFTSDKKYVHTFTLFDSSAVTSGDYERYYIVDGRRYNHIINKDTLMPADKFASVTVIVENSGLADGLSTALFCMDYERGRALIESIDGASAVWVMSDGTVRIN